MITIRELPTLSPDLSLFQRNEWVSADITHFGRTIDWTKITKVLQATDKDEVVGVLELTMQAGVMHIDSIIISHKRQGLGIGKELMMRSEEIAKQHKMHKIYLDTGKNWPATKFYESLGYIKTGDLPNHFENQDYIEYSKFLSAS